MYCTSCGKEIQDGIKFCPYCGTQVGEAADVVPVESMTSERSILGEEKVNSETVAKLKRAKEIIDDAYALFEEAARMEKKIIYVGFWESVFFLFLLFCDGYALCILFLDSGSMKDVLEMLALIAVLSLVTWKEIRRVTSESRCRKKIRNTNQEGMMYLEAHISELEFIPKEYRNQYALDYIINIIETGRVSTLNQAYDKFDSKIGG